MSKEKKHSETYYSVCKDMIKTVSEDIERNEIMKRYATRKMITDKKYEQMVRMHADKIKQGRDLLDFLIEVVNE